MSSQIFGWHISPNGTDETAILEHVRRSGARTHTVLHSAGLARKVYDTAIASGVVDPIIILRAQYPDQNWTEAPFDNPDKFVADRAALVGDWGYLQWLNEPIATNEAQLTSLLDSCIAFMDACEKYGVKGAVGGFADAATFQQAWLQAGLFNKFLKRAVTWTRDGHGVIVHHDYSEGAPMKNGGGHSHTDMLDPAKMQPANWPTAAEMQQPAPGGWLDFSAQVAPNFDLDIAYQAALFLTAGRGLRPEYDYARTLFQETHSVTPNEFLETTYFVQAADFNWTAMRYMYPLIWARMLMGLGYLFVVGEYGPQDDMPHLRVMGFTAELERVAAGGRKLRGPLEQADFYIFWWPGVPRAKAHIRILRWQAGVIPPECLGYTLFALNPDWPTFNYLLWLEFWLEFNTLTDELRGLLVTTRPANAGTGKRGIVQTSSSIRVRSTAGTDGAVIGGLVQGNEVEWFPATAKVVGSYEWAWVEKAALMGWAARVWPSWDEQYTPIVAPPPPPPTDSAEVIALRAANATLITQVATLTASLASANARVDSLISGISSAKGLAMDVSEKAGHLTNLHSDLLESPASFSAQVFSAFASATKPIRHAPRSVRYTSIAIALVFIVAVLLTVTFPENSPLASLSVQPTGVPMNEMLAFLVFLAGIDNRIVETLKQAWASKHLDAAGEPTPPPAWALLLTSMVVGVGMAAGTQLNLFSFSAALTVPTWLGILLTGLTIGAGSNSLHTLTEIVGAITGVFDAKAAQAETTTTSTKTTLKLETSAEQQTDAAA